MENVLFIHSKNNSFGRSHCWVFSIAFVMSVIEKLTEFLNMLTMKYELRNKCWINTVVMIQSMPHCLCWLFYFQNIITFLFEKLNLLRHRVRVGSLSRFKLTLPQCNVPGVWNCMSVRLSMFSSLYWRYLCISYENWQNPKVNTSSNMRQKVSGKFMIPPS